jgi:hypothetical protein
MNTPLKVVNSRQVEYQNQKPFGYSTENHFTNQKYFFNSNINNDNNGNGYKIKFKNINFNKIIKSQ